jgi:hypothetical protein
MYRNFFVTVLPAIRGNFQSIPAALDGTDVAFEKAGNVLVGPGAKQFVLLQPPFFAANKP